MKYPAKFERTEEGRYMVTFREFPEGGTEGDDEQEAMLMAEDLLFSVVEFRIDDSLQVPMPSEPLAGERMVELRPDVAEKVGVHNRRVGVQPKGFNNGGADELAD